MIWFDTSPPLRKDKGDAERYRRERRPSEFDGSSRRIFRKERLHRQATCRRMDVGAPETNVAQKMVIDLQQRLRGDISLTAASVSFQCTVEKDQGTTRNGIEALNSPAKCSQPNSCSRDRCGCFPTPSAAGHCSSLHALDVRLINHL